MWNGLTEMPMAKDAKREEAGRGNRGCGDCGEGEMKRRWKGRKALSCLAGSGEWMDNSQLSDTEI